MAMCVVRLIWWWYVDFLMVLVVFVNGFGGIGGTKQSLIIIICLFIARSGFIAGGLTCSGYVCTAVYKV